MAAFPTWIKKNHSSDAKVTVMSPRQTANKAYSLGIKKLDKDEKRRRPQYSIREKLLLSNTLAKAEEMLNKPCSNRKSWCEQEEDVLAPLPHYAPPSEVKVQQWLAIDKSENKQTQIKTEIKTRASYEDSVTTIPEQVALSIAAIAVAFQQQEQSKHQQQHIALCRPIHIPPYPFNNSSLLTPIL